jgi:uncharacterized protein (UPF0297 family)
MYDNKNQGGFGMQDNKQKTIMFPIKDQNKQVIKETLQSVYNSLKEKGYNPINQIVGYILSEDPTYITNYNNARAVISKIDRDELLRVLVENFLTL